MFRVFPVFILLFGCLILPGCETADRFGGGAPQVVAEPDNVSAMLADAATRASASLERLAAIESARGPGVAMGSVGNAPAELRRAISVSWVGPIEPVTKMLADRAGYRFSVSGKEPPTTVIVALDIENRPVIDVLRDIGLQLGLRGDVRVDAPRKLVEIHYAPDGSNSGF